MAGTSGGKHSAIAFGLPGRFMISDLPRTPAIARERIAVGHTAKRESPLSLAKTGQFLFNDIKRCLRCDVPLCRPGASGRQDQVAVFLVGQKGERAADVFALVRNDSGDHLARLFPRLAEDPFDLRTALVRIDSRPMPCR